MNQQPRDILYLIISFLAYTPDTARFGRVCKYIDSIPGWYERSGHVQPHDEYKETGQYYRDGRASVGYIQNQLDDRGRLVMQEHVYQGGYDAQLIHLNAETGMPIGLKTLVGEDATVITLQDRHRLRVELLQMNPMRLVAFLYFHSQTRTLQRMQAVTGFDVEEKGGSNLDNYDRGVFAYLAEEDGDFGIVDMFE
jgi:hypothetical protein